MMLKDHPEITRTLRTGYPYPFKSLFCADCGRELTDKLYISDGDTVCNECAKERILCNYDADDLAAAFDIPQTTVADYLSNPEGI